MSKKQTVSKSSNLVCPLIRVAGEKHPLEEMVEKGKAPEMKAIGYMKLTSGQHSWVSYVITFQGDKVKKIEVGEPDMRAIAEDAAKMDFVQAFIDSELM